MDEETPAVTSGHQGPSVVDLPIAVKARHHGLKVLHYDRDFATIAKAADVEIEWVAQPGSVNRPPPAVTSPWGPACGDVTVRLGIPVRSATLYGPPEKLCPEGIL
ncbi:hypothetical protein [Streptosporangium minutum]|uniref:PIN domain-containing protein n=1 Tax=Streptosporangium minutum TaxID=569862 RepID=A0A2C9ZK95_9ACTN|nr:hypothetical protein [Streptosporangium minutum]OUC83014.1 hypothetical protein CA984_40985 [Streptosporangium minutum]